MTKTSKLTLHMREVRSAAKDALEVLTGNTLDECRDNPKANLQSRFAMDQRFEITEENQLAHSAFRICELTDEITGRTESLRQADYKLGEPEPDEYEAPGPASTHSTNSLLREMDREVMKFGGALKICQRQTRECKDDASGKELRQLRRFADALKEIKTHAMTIDEALSGMQETLNFRKGPGR